MDTQHRDYDVNYKVLMIGDSGVGKTALIHSLMGIGFSPNHNTTIGIDFVKKIFEVDGAHVQLEIWDTAGQERFRTITKFQYRGTKGLMLVYDVTSKNSFNMLDYWMDSIDKEIDQDTTEPIPVFLLANKKDLGQERVITEEQGQKVAESHYVYGFLETSAKEGHNVFTAFRELALAVTEINNNKLLDSYLKPNERKEKYAARFHNFTIQEAPSGGKNKKTFKLLLCFPRPNRSKHKDKQHKNNDTDTTKCCPIG